MQNYLKYTNRFIVTAILSFVLLAGCAGQENIQIPSSDPIPHPKLTRMQSTSIKERDGVVYFGESKKYKKRGITVVALKGEPYEMGYAHGILLKEEMKPIFKELLYWMKTRSYGTSVLENTLRDRAREIEQYIPEKYIEELKGLAAGSDIEYELILLLSSGSTIAKAYFCTSVAVKTPDGKLIRSRSLEHNLNQILKSSILFINQPTRGYAFASVGFAGMIGTMTAMNETGLNFGAHAIWKAPTDYKGIPHEIMNREIIENSRSVEEVGEILKKARRSRPLLSMVTDLKNARIYEYDSENIGFKDMEQDRLVLTNYTQVLDIGASYICPRYNSATNFLNNHQDQMNVQKLVELNRSDSISCVNSERQYSLHLAIFIPDTLDFWIAVDPPPASRGRWIGFNLKKELDGSGHEPNPSIIPAMSAIVIADNIRVDEKEPWTGKWRVESSSQGSGIWAMKQTGEIVKSTAESAYDFNGRVRGSQLKGNMEGASSSDLSFVMEMHPDAMLFKGIYKIWGRSYQLIGRRIE